ncbi:hypothetical protein BDW02DRAFT_462744, partial [Decorospora gaudefroyi]
YQVSSRILEAETFLRQEIDARSEVLGSDHRALAALSSELAQVFASQARFSEAEQRQEHVVEILGLHFGDRHPRPLLAKIDLAQIFADRLLLNKAELLYETVIPTLQDIVGAENADVASALQNFANLRANLGKLQQAAERYCKDGLHWASEMLGDDHFKTIALNHVLAFTYLSRGNDAEAEAVLSDRFLEQAKGSETEIYVLEDLATLKEHQGRSSEAHDMRIRAMQLCHAILGKSSPKSLDLWGEVLSAELDRNWSGELESLVLENIKAKKQSVGNSHRSIIKSMVDLAAAYGRAHQFDKAERLIEEVKAICIATELQDPARHANNLTRTAEIYFYMDRFDEAEELEMQALDIRKAIFGEDHEYVARTMNNLATTLHRKGELRRAEELLQHVLRIRE